MELFSVFRDLSIKKGSVLLSGFITDNLLKLLVNIWLTWKRQGFDKVLKDVLIFRSRTDQRAAIQELVFGGDVLTVLSSGFGNAFIFVNPVFTSLVIDLFTKARA